MENKYVLYDSLYNYMLICLVMPKGTHNGNKVYSIIFCSICFVFTYISSLIILSYYSSVHFSTFATLNPAGSLHSLQIVK